jgi:HK97 family phage major capsid protein
MSAAVSRLPHSNGAIDGTVLAARSEPPKSLSDHFMESVAYTGYQKSMKASPVAEIKLDSADFGLKTVFTETGFAPQAVRIPRIVETALQAPHVADLIPSGATNQIAIVYMEETSLTNAAAAVAEGGAKPESALAFTERSSPVRKLATVLPITDELMADAPAMRSYVEARLRLFLAIAEDVMLLTGSGVAPNLTGLLNVAGIQTQAKGADPTPDTIYKAMVKIETAAYVPASGVVMHPLDWQDIALLRTADGLYIWGAPMDMGPKRVWGLPVVTTTAMTQNTGLVGAFDTCTQLFRRAEVTFAISTEHSDFFIRNQMMLRVEMREALVVYRPLGLCTISGV